LIHSFIGRAKLHGWQDTYVFTKAMGEMVINCMRGEIPVVTIRPSVIESTWRDPFPGWMEGNRMMDPVVLYYGKGQLTGFLADPNGILDVVRSSSDGAGERDPND
jgi:alcohol-forming fatty acyl-CoA reductase